MSKDLLENDLATGTFKRSNVPCGANQVVGRGAAKAGNPKNVAEKHVIPSAERGTECRLVEEQGTRIARSEKIPENPPEMKKVDQWAPKRILGGWSCPWGIVLDLKDVTRYLTPPKMGIPKVYFTAAVQSGVTFRRVSAECALS